MEKETETFLQSLKPGDEVAVKDKAMEFGYAKWYSIYKVKSVGGKKRITITLENGQKFTHGSLRIGGTWGHTHYLEPVTEAVRTNMAEYVVEANFTSRLSKVSALNYDRAQHLPLEQKQKMAGLLLQVLEIYATAKAP